MEISLVQMLISLLHLYFSMASTGIPSKDLITTVGNTSNNFDGILDIASLCPYNRFCNSSPSKEILSGDFESCCEPCSCSLNCVEIGNCCPDMPLAGVAEPKYPCANLNTLLNDVNGKSVMAKYDLWYHVITDCPDMISGMTYPRCKQPTELHDFVIVSNPENGRVYKNKHCARCNDVQNYVIWMMGVQCPDIALLPFESYKERDEYIVQTCSLLSVPPDRTAGALSRCLPTSYLIAQCNVTGQWDFYEKEIEHSCHANRIGQNVVFTEEFEYMKGYKQYANVYCYLCNNPQFITKKDMCLVRELDFSVKSFFVPFVALLNTPEEHSSIKGIHCGTSKIWDKFSRLCRPLLCPGSTIPVHGTCRSSLAYSFGYSVEVNFEATFIAGFQDATDLKFLRNLEGHILNKLTFKMNCGKCSSKIFRQKNSTALLFRLVLYSTKDCSVYGLKFGIHKLATKSPTDLGFKHQGQYTHVKLRLFLEKVEHLEEIARMIHKHCIRNIDVIDSSIFQYCPRINITRHELYTLGLKDTINKTNTDSLSDVIEETDRQQVCIDSYFQKRVAMSGAVSRYQMNKRIIQPWILILSYAVCKFYKAW